LEGDHVFALPYASCFSTFQAPGWGRSAVFPPRRWRNTTPRESVPFSHRSASRIFIMQPGCAPPPAVTQDGDHQPLGGEKQAGLRSWAEPELYLPRGFVGHPLLRRSRERALAGPAGGSDFDNAVPVDSRRRQPQRVRLVGLAPGATSCLKAATAPCAREDRPRCRALLGRRSCSGAVLPLHRYGASAWRSVPCSSGRIRVGICRRADGPCRRCRGGGGSRSPRHRRDHRHHPRFGPPTLCTCPRPSSVGVGEGRVAAAFALRPSPFQFGHP
jgi:hypothetical protein